MKQVAEREIQAYFLALCETYKILHWRMALGGVRRAGGVMAKSTISGFPDIAGVTHSGQFWACELKRPGGKLSEKQEAWIKDLKASNAIVGVVSSHEDAIAFIAELIR